MLGHAIGPHPAYGYVYNSERERQSAMKDECVACCAGLASEHVFFAVPLNTDNENAQGDFDNIMKLEGLGLRIPGKCNGSVGDEMTWGYIARCLKNAKKHVKKHRDVIDRLANVLIERQRLSAEEVGELLCNWFSED